jgi:hypothetical protein
MGLQWLVVAQIGDSVPEVLRPETEHLYLYDLGQEL